jgi:uncharacterized membrane protein YsdA (DUF1294 family)
MEKQNSLSPYSGRFISVAIAIGILFLAGTFALVERGMFPRGIFVLYLAASVTTAVVYRMDKSAAQSGGWRTAESTLHILALIGGWPGALIAQSVFRHKSRKTSFRATFLLTVALNCAALLWFWWGTSA